MGNNQGSDQGKKGKNGSKQEQQRNIMDSINQQFQNSKMGLQMLKNQIFDGKNNEYKGKLGKLNDEQLHIQYEQEFNKEQVDIQKLKKLAVYGIPSQFRGKSWRYLLGQYPSNKNNQKAHLAQRFKIYNQLMHQYLEKNEINSFLKMMDKQISNQGRVYQFNEVNSQLGEGSFGKVFKGTYLGTNDQVAIKQINKGILKKYGDEILQAIGSEVNILQQISLMGRQNPCPFIVNIYDCFETGNSIYIILEFCNQGDVQQLYNKRKQEGNPLSEKESKKILYELLMALKYLEQNGITHRDIKPENIFIKDGVYKLGDFGFAAQKSIYTTTLGTYPFMAPEIFIQDNYSNEVDIWASGVVYHFLLFHELYFIGRSQMEVEKKIREKPYIIDKPGQVSQESQDLLKKMIEKDPKLRIKAQDAVNHPLFNDIKNDQSILNISGPKLSPNNNALDEIQNRDNLTQKQIPKNMKISEQEWAQFTSGQSYQNCMNLLNNDRQALTNKFQKYYQELDWFNSSYFQNDLNSIKLIVNDDLLKDVPEDLFKQQIKNGFQECMNRFQREVDKQGQQAQFLLLCCFMLAAVGKIDSIVEKKAIDFEKFQQEKNNMSVNDIFAKIASINQH
ncbi:Rab-GTPase-TBC domain [Pseudocohnilembus persalinus]|uniref:Rab-GTPase-TBC domain n=1 Tax=Pseudocohnilembus persalinus TaxID=266149 RepID=A0A0V0R0N5_PSEPJ|nr:Rab-GTPase-TBC domain [Pseudocohnilembus persalinus]|eukprot:KRX08017.1 Rab-GTPase-TBC domain [Pseudocohnilembus persalinus]